MVGPGPDGCRRATAGGVEHIPAFPARVVDTTGAGDAHIGAFAAAIARGEPPARACLYGNAVASVVVANWGPVTAPSLEVADALISGGR
jgi:sugar/nucleoside kinase (ribokinase family)